MIGIIIGSESDVETMRYCADKLEEFGIAHKMVVASAHRNPEKVTALIKQCEEQGYKIIIAAAGMSAALPGVVASQTKLPVIGVPMKSDLMGIDSLLSIVQMPKGVPVACMIDSSKLNLSPMLEIDASVFVKTPQELVTKILESFQESEIKNIDVRSFFELDSSLPRWLNFIKKALNLKRPYEEKL